jgi:hypothetical protein
VIATNGIVRTAKCGYCKEQIPTEHIDEHDKSNLFIRERIAVLKWGDLGILLVIEKETERYMTRAIACPEAVCLKPMKKLRLALKASIADKHFEESCNATKKKGALAKS